MPEIRKPVHITVETFIGDSEEPESSRVIDHSDHLHRQWLAKHTHWAMRNERQVELRPVI
jgi:hypothetical protein